MPISPASSFRQEIEAKAQVNFNRCYQCFTCALGCPVAEFTQHTPNQIIRMIQLGLREDVLQSDLIWICASCETCAARCPNDIEIVKVMDVLRILSLESPGKDVRDIASTHRFFIKLVQKFGRIYEMGYVMGMKIFNPGSLLSLRGLVEDGILGWKMVTKGKLHLLPYKTKGAVHIQKIAQKIEARKKQQEEA